MAKSRSPLVIIFITIFIDLIGFGIVIPVLPLYAKEFNASESTVGILLAIYSAMQFIFAPILGKLSDRVGRRPVLLYSLIGTSIGFTLMGLAPQMPLGFALFGLAPTLVWLFIARIIDGISGGNISTAQAYIADVTPPEQRSRGMGLIGAAFGLGFIFGPALAALLSHISHEAPFFFAAALALANATAVYFLLPESLSAEQRSHSARPISISQIFRESGSWHLKVILATFFFVTVAFAMLTASIALFANRRFDFDVTHTGYMFTYVGVLGAIIQGGLLGRLVKAFGEKNLAVAGAAMFAASLFALPTSTTVPAMLIACTGIAVGTSLTTPTLNGLASKSVSPLWQGRILGVLASIASLARIIGPVLGDYLLGRDSTQGVPLEHYGRTPYWTSAVLMLVALGLAITLHSKREVASEGTAAAEGQR
jgi:DHA1 family tetracycline resistance protein-like MFS transporter